MLRINLLPSYVAQRRQNKKFIAGWIVAFIAVVACVLLLEFAWLTPEDLTEKQMAQDAVKAHNNITALNNLATTTVNAVGPIKAKITFFQQVQQYNLLYPELYMNIARFTSPKILYTGMNVSGSTLTIDAYTPSIEELGRYLQVMYHEPDITSISVASIPTPDQAAEKVYMYNGNVIGMSGGGASTTAGAGGAAGKSTIPGVPPGVTVTLPPGVTLPGGPNSNQPGVPQQGAPNFEQQARATIGEPGALPPLTPNTQPGGQGNAQQGSAFGYLLNQPDFNPKLFKVIVRKTDGFSFVATCTLKQPLTPPVAPTPGAAPAPSGPGGPGGPGGPSNS